MNQSVVKQNLIDAALIAGGAIAGRYASSLFKPKPGDSDYVGAIITAAGIGMTFIEQPHINKIGLGVAGFGVLRFIGTFKGGENFGLTSESLGCIECGGTCGGKNLSGCGCSGSAGIAGPLREPKRLQIGGMAGDGVAIEDYFSSSGNLLYEVKSKYINDITPYEFNKFRQALLDRGLSPTPLSEAELQMWRNSFVKGQSSSDDAMYRWNHLTDIINARAAAASTSNTSPSLSVSASYTVPVMQQQTDPAKPVLQVPQAPTGPTPTLTISPTPSDVPEIYLLPKPQPQPAPVANVLPDKSKFSDFCTTVLLNN